MELKGAHVAVTGAARGIGLATATAFAAFLTEAGERHGEVDVLVTNAGVMPNGRFPDRSLRSQR